MRHIAVITKKAPALINRGNCRAAVHGGLRGTLFTTTLLPSSTIVVIESAAGTVLVLGNVSDPMGGILLKTPSGAAINITASGITINNGQGATIALEANRVVVNNVPLNPP